MTSKGLFLVSALVLGACTIAHPKSVPQLTFSHFAPLTLNVRSASVLESFRTKTVEGDVSGQFIMPPSDAVQRYAANRFKNNGAADGSMVLDIQDSFVTLRQIEQQSKILEWADIGKEDEYRVYLQVQVIAQPSGFKGRQTTTIKFDRTLIMPSSITIAEREMRQTRFLEKLVFDLDARVNEALEQTPAIHQ